MPASSSACQLVSSIMRCCGSRSWASTGEIRKKAASKRSMSSTNAPKRHAAPRAASSGNISPRRPAPEPGSPSLTAFPPRSMRLQNSGRLGAPGKRQAMPTIAMASPCPPARCPLSGRSSSLMAVLRGAITVMFARLRGRTQAAAGNLVVVRRPYFILSVVDAGAATRTVTMSTP